MTIGDKLFFILWFVFILGMMLWMGLTAEPKDPQVTPDPIPAVDSKWQFITIEHPDGRKIELIQRVGYDSFNVVPPAAVEYKTLPIIQPWKEVAPSIDPGIIIDPLPTNVLRYLTNLAAGVTLLTEEK